MLLAVPSRAIVRFDGTTIELISYYGEMSLTVSLTPRRAIQLAHDLIGNALHIFARDPL
jgi:hypothetical protein